MHKDDITPSRQTIDSNKHDQRKLPEEDAARPTTQPDRRGESENTTSDDDRPVPNDSSHGHTGTRTHAYTRDATDTTRHTAHGGTRTGPGPAAAAAGGGEAAQRAPGRRRSGPQRRGERAGQGHDLDRDQPGQFKPPTVRNLGRIAQLLPASWTTRSGCYRCLCFLNGAHCFNLLCSSQNISNRGELF